jgi:uncharacterized RDD family membrane protein YckC
MQYAGFWLRYIAWLIDSAILSALPLIVGLIIAPIFFTGSKGVAALGVIIFLVPVIGTTGWLYYALMESSTFQATLGKRALGLRVVGINGEPASFGRTSARFFAKILSSILLIGYLMAAFTEKKQALHDMIAACIVICGAPPVMAGINPDRSQRTP